MARKIQTIKAQIIAQKNADAVLSGLTSPSQTALFNLWAYITAVAIGIFEQILDVFKVDMEAIVNKSAPSTYVWIREKVKLFQYGSSVLLNLTDLTYYYAAPDVDKQIVTRVSVSKGTNKQVLVKVAKSEPPVAFSGGEVSALQAYVEEVCGAGIDYKVSSAESDKLYVKAEVFYQGQFSSTIEDDVIAAINAYLSNLSSPENFNGVVRVSALQDAIQNVIGVNDVVLKEVKIRGNATAFGSATVLIGSPDTLINFKSSTTVSGYVVSETTVSNTLEDSLIFTAV